jgi:hypothetical protein
VSGLVLGIERNRVTSEVFKLYRGSSLLGKVELKAELCDFPWYGGSFTAAADYAKVEHLFREELRLLEEDEMDAWSEIWNQIEEPGLKLVPDDGTTPVTDLIIHIEEGEARWRC